MESKEVPLALYLGAPACSRVPIVSKGVSLALYLGPPLALGAHLALDQGLISLQGPLVFKGVRLLLI